MKNVRNPCLGLSAGIPSWLLWKPDDSHTLIYWRKVDFFCGCVENILILPSDYPKFHRKVFPRSAASTWFLNKSFQRLIWLEHHDNCMKSEHHIFTTSGSEVLTHIWHAWMYDVKSHLWSIWTVKRSVQQLSERWTAHCNTSLSSQWQVLFPIESSVLVM